MCEKRTGTAICQKPGGTYLLRRVAQFGKDESGNIIILAALIMPLMVGGMGLGVEMSYRYQQQRKIHHAADVAAHGAAVRAAFGDQETTYRANGRQLAG